MRKNKCFEEIVKSISGANVSENAKHTCSNFTDSFNRFMVAEYETSNKHATNKQYFEEAVKEYDKRIKNPSIFSNSGLHPNDQIRIYNSFQKYNNQIVFDLGAGVVPDRTYNLLNDLGAKAYIGVEPFNYKEGKEALESSIDYFKKKYPLKKFIPYTFVESDINSILERVPDNSSSFIASGIGWCIINSNYFEECNSLIEKKLNPKGIFISYASDFFSYRNQKLDNLDIWRPLGNSKLLIAEKRDNFGDSYSSNNRNKNSREK